MPGGVAGVAGVTRPPYADPSRPSRAARVRVVYGLCAGECQSSFFDSVGKRVGESRES